MKIINLSQKERARLIVEKEWTIENAAYYFCNVKNKILYGIHDSTEPSTQYVEIQPTIEGLINEMIKFFQTKSLENATPLQKVYIQCRRLILQQYQLGKMIYTKDPPIKQIIEEFEPIIITRYSSIDVFQIIVWGINHYSKNQEKLPAIINEYSLQKLIYLSDNYEKLETENKKYRNDLAKIKSKLEDSKQNQPFSDKVYEQCKFLSVRGVRLDLWICLFYKSYKLFWKEALTLLPLPPVKSVEEQEARDKEEENKIKTIRSWFDSKGCFKELNIGHIPQDIKGMLSPKNKGGRTVGSKNLKGRKK